ncbi:nucleoside 2-deoxyribosyltransferase [Pseudomonas qingdaonensis]|uniref:nucleoside 2-deoxyribosyltransferase n=1 Tax=Pseudomonas qingdaonensis TaxID=2056231 RepID=UPI0018CA017E|nr:nucleoside 2-deoxyribosyltransferase [Pseudomonas qingdaonensis]MBG8558322.1 nucleoside 2-deoxyribosyltransferase [Pseudomonas qingdaonensis]
MLKKPSIYLAAPLFNEAELAYNKALKGRLQAYFNVFLPQEDGLLLRDIVANGTSSALAERMVFDADIVAMRESDLILAILNGAHIDEGVSFELGFCFALGKRCVGLKSDVRQALPTGNNPMINQSCERIFNTTESLVSWLIATYARKPYAAV